MIAVESRSLVAFDEWDEAYLDIVANQVGVAIANTLDREREDEATAGALEPMPASAPPSSSAIPGAKALRIRFYDGDDCVFAVDEYLVRMPGRILWRILRMFKNTGRTELSNRELRLDSSLGLPAVRDNLESRLILLRKRLAAKCPQVRLVSTGRGLFRRELDCDWSSKRARARSSGSRSPTLRSK